MFPCATNEIISHTDVQRPVSSACRNVNPETQGSDSWVPAFAGTNGCWSPRLNPPHSNPVGSARVAEIGVGEQCIEGQHLADHALLEGVAQHGLEVLAVGGSQT